MPLDITRHIASIRNQPGGNWLAMALERIAVQVNLLEHRIVTAPHRTGQE